MQGAIFLFAILTIAGSWSAWRRSPLYSHKTTIELVAVFLLLIGVILGGTSAILSGGFIRSTVAQAIIGGVLFIGVGIGATTGIIRITDSHLATLPPDARIVTTERHKVQRWIWRIAAYIAISGAAILVVPSDWSWLPGVPALLLLLGAGPSMAALYMRARRLDLGLSQTLASPWVRWQYTAEEWQAWARNQMEWERSKNYRIVWKRDWPKLLLGLLLFLWLFVGSAWFAVSGGAGDKLRAAGAAIAIFAVCMGLLRLATRGAPERRYRRLLAAPREAVFGGEGVYANGQFAPWILSGSYLVEATAHRDPPARLELIFCTATGSSTMMEARRVPIPDGRDADLAAIQQGLRRCCPKAAIRLA